MHANKKRLLIVGTSMTIGGVERAMISLLSIIPYDKYDVTLLLIDKSGEFLKYIPREVKCRQIKFLHGIDGSKGFTRFVKSQSSLHGIANAALIVLGTTLYKFCGISYVLKNNVLDVKPKTYDFILNFYGPNIISNIVCEEIMSCNKKYIWVHNEFQKAGTNIKKNGKHYKQYNKIFCVSKVIEKEMISSYPEMTNRITTLYNVVNRDYILEMADQGNGLKKRSDLLILSTGRLHQQKGFDIAVEAAKILVERGLAFKWYVLGEGEERERLELLIKKYDLKEKFILLGSVDNPYPFFRTCDIYVQPSRFEGFCLTLAESKIFNKPAVVTSFAGADEQIENEVNGLIVSTTPEGLAEGILKLANDGKMYHFIMDNLVKEEKIVDQFGPIGKYLS